MNSIKFRQLNADEISVRIGRINAGGVSLLLYKDARCDQVILDETVGPLNWQRAHSRDNGNCTVSIWDDAKQVWVSKEDCGTESNTEAEKGKASDSFKRACVNWGIGRELYTAPNMFIFKGDLSEFVTEGGQNKCHNTFKCLEINYADGKITDLVIGVYDRKGALTMKKRFSNTASTVTSFPGKESAKPTVTKEYATSPEANKVSAGIMPDDEVLLFGSCKGKRYGDVKESKIFASFLNWLKTSDARYPDAKTQSQYDRLRKQVA